MTNLLGDILGSLDEAKKTEEDILWVGSRDGVYGLSWSEFRPIADVTEFDSGYGGAEIAEDLVVVFGDGSWLERHEYDGAEWWEYKSEPVRSADTKPFHTAYRGDQYWTKLAEMNEARSDASS
jgi:hypothetical protein